MSFPTPPAGVQVDASPTIFEYPVQAPGVNTQSAPAVATPAIPLTTVAVTNTNSVDVMVYLISGGAAVTVIKVNGVTTGLNLAAATTSGASVYLPVGATISLTYATTAPTWVWLAV